MSAKQKDPYVIKLIGDVDESMVLKVVEDLEKWDGKSIINVHLCTDGGDIYSSHAIYDLLSRIKESDIPVCPGG